MSRFFSSDGCCVDKYSILILLLRSNARVKFDSGLIFLDRSQFFAMLATNEIALLCTDNDHVKWLFFVFAKVGKRRLSRF